MKSLLLLPITATHLTVVQVSTLSHTVSTTCNTLKKKKAKADTLALQCLFKWCLIFYVLQCSYTEMWLDQVGIWLSTHRCCYWLSWTLVMINKNDTTTGLGSQPQVLNCNEAKVPYGSGSCSDWARILKKKTNISSLSDLKPPLEVAQIWFEKLGFVVMGPGGRIQATWAYCVNTEWNGSFF